jgi:hypothetical protein
MYLTPKADYAMNETQAPSVLDNWNLNPSFTEGLNAQLASALQACI